VNPKNESLLSVLSVSAQSDLVALLKSESAKAKFSISEA
jgi:hypothetical protein